MKIWNSNKFLFVASTLVLWLNFSFHVLSTLPLERFMDGEFASERFIFSRLVFDLEHGTEAMAGLLLFYKHVDGLYKTFAGEDYRVFRDRLRDGHDKIARVNVSHYGLQDDLVFPVWKSLEALKNKMLTIVRPGSRWERRLQDWDLYYYNLFSQNLVAFVNATALALFVLWGARQFSTVHAWVVLGFIVLTLPALSFFGRSMWWMLWSWFLPFLIILWSARAWSGKPPGWLVSAAAGVLAGLAVCLKGLMGYEFLAPTMVAAMVPIVFYGVLYKWGWQPSVRVSMVVGLFCLLGAIGALALHWAALENYGLDGMDVIQARYEMRAYGGAAMSGVTGEIVESTKAPLFGVLVSYLVSPKKLAVPQILMMAPFLWWLWGYVRWGRREMSDAQRSLPDAFIAAITLAFLGGASMLIILKGHAYVHGFDIVIWCIPLNLFLLQFYALCLIGGSPFPFQRLHSPTPISGPASDGNAERGTKAT